VNHNDDKNNASTFHDVMKDPTIHAKKDNGLESIHERQWLVSNHETPAGNLVLTSEMPKSRSVAAMQNVDQLIKRAVDILQSVYERTENSKANYEANDVTKNSLNTTQSHDSLGFDNIYPRSEPADNNVTKQNNIEINLHQTDISSINVDEVEEADRINTSQHKQNKLKQSDETTQKLSENRESDAQLLRVPHGRRLVGLLVRCSNDVDVSSMIESTEISDDTEIGNLNNSSASAVSDRENTSEVGKPQLTTNIPSSQNHEKPTMFQSTDEKTYPHVPSKEDNMPTEEGKWCQKPGCSTTNAALALCLDALKDHDVSNLQHHNVDISEHDDSKSTSKRIKIIQGHFVNIPGRVKLRNKSAAAKRTGKYFWYYDDDQCCQWLLTRIH